MWHAWGTKGDIHGFGGERDQRRPLGRWMHRRDDNNKVDFKDISWEYVEQTDLTEDRDKRWAP